MSRIILSVLRQASLTTRDIALQLLIERALDKSDLQLLPLDDKAGWSRAPGPAGKRRRPLRSGAGAVHAMGDCAIAMVLIAWCRPLAEIFFPWESLRTH